MAVQYNSSDYNVVIPKLPTLPKYQPKQPTSNNTDPSAYYTKALGFLPLDVRYMSNPTNSLSYNSMADVLLNHRAWEERWGRESWLNTPLGYIPRLVVDTALLLKHQTIDPIVQGVIDDGWTGLLRGTSTAAMNSLINFGNTLDIVSNPIKGLFIDGGEGFVKGLVGDHEGRKQYDYTDYIDTGNGIADFVLSMGAEILSDPLNLISFGSGLAIKQGARTAAETAQEAVTKAVNTAFKKAAKTTIKRGARSIDDVAAAIVKGTGMDEAAAKAIASSLAEDVVDKTTGVVTKAVTKKSANTALDGLSEQLAKAYTRLGKTPTKQVKATADSIANSLLSGKSTRAKASLFGKGQVYTPAQQQVVASYLKNLDVSKLLTNFKLSSGVYKTVENIERVLRYTGGITGLDLFIGGDKLRKHIGKRINNARVKKDLPHIIKTINDFDAELKFNYNKDVVVEDPTTVTKILEQSAIDKHTAVFDELFKYKDACVQKLQNLANAESYTAAQVRTILTEFSDKIDGYIKKAFSKNKAFRQLKINSLDAYINYFKTISVEYPKGVFDENIKGLQILKDIVSQEIENPTVFRQFKTSLECFTADTNAISDKYVGVSTRPADWGKSDLYKHYYIKDGTEYKQLARWPNEITDWDPKKYYRLWGQEDSMQAYRATKKHINDVIKQVDKYNKEVDEALKFISEPENLDKLKSIVKDVEEALLAEKQDTTFLTNYTAAFEEAMVDYSKWIDGNEDEIIDAAVLDSMPKDVRMSVIDAYTDLVEHLKTLVSFTNSEDASVFIKNKIGASNVSFKTIYNFLELDAHAVRNTPELYEAYAARSRVLNAAYQDQEYLDILKKLRAAEDPELIKEILAEREQYLVKKFNKETLDLYHKANMLDGFNTTDVNTTTSDFLETIKLTTDTKEPYMLGDDIKVSRHLLTESEAALLAKEKEYKALAKKLGDIELDPKYKKLQLDLCTARAKYLDCKKTLDKFTDNAELYLNKTYGSKNIAAFKFYEGLQEVRKSGDPVKIKAYIDEHYDVNSALLDIDSQIKRYLNTEYSYSTVSNAQRYDMYQSFIKNDETYLKLLNGDEAKLKKYIKHKYRVDPAVVLEKPAGYDWYKKHIAQDTTYQDLLSKRTRILNKEAAYDVPTDYTWYKQSLTKDANYQNILEERQMYAEYLADDKYMLDKAQQAFDAYNETLPHTWLDRINKIKETTYITASRDAQDLDLLTRTYSTVDSARIITQMIDELPTFSVKRFDEVVDIEAYAKYKLVTYTAMFRKGHIINELMGIAENGKIKSADVLELEVTLSIKPTELNQGKYKDVLTLLHKADLLPKTDLLKPGQRLAHDDFRDTLEHVFGLFYEVMNDGDLFIAPELHRLSHKLKHLADRAVGKEKTRLQSLASVILSEARSPSKSFIQKMSRVSQQANALLGESDETLDALFNTQTKAVSFKGAGLQQLLVQFEDSNSTLYKLLNAPDPLKIFTEHEYQTVVLPTKILLQRLQGYKTLVSEITQLVDNNGYGDLHRAAVMDALVSVLSGKTGLGNKPINGVVEDIMSKMDLFIKNRLDTQPTNMDSVLSNLVKELEADTTLPAEVTSLIEHMRDSLKSGKAHNAVVDVDNWVSLMQLAKYSKKPLYGNLMDSLVYTAAGKHIVVFDIETLGAKEASAIPFQISGKVLNADGTIVSGSEFNYIIKPPKGAVPLRSVREKITPTGVDFNKWWQENIVNAKTIEGQQKVFENVADAINELMLECNKYSDTGFILAGQNIKAFDIDILSKQGYPSAKTFFENIEVFDSLDSLNNNSVFLLQGDYRNAFAFQLNRIFQNADAIKNPVLKHTLFTYDDVQTLGSFKDLYNTKHHSKALSKSEHASIFGEVDYDADNVSTSAIQGYIVNDPFSIDTAIDSIKAAWASPSKFKGKTYFTVTQLNPDSLEDSIQNLLKELEDIGLLDVKPGKNIVQFFNTNVANGRIVLNAKRVASYEITDFFDVEKITKFYSEDGKTVSFNTLQSLTQTMKSIKRHYSYLSQKVVDAMAPKAHAFLKYIQDSKDPHLKTALLLYGDIDNRSAVAAAIYFYDQISSNKSLQTTNPKLLKDLESYGTFNTLREVKDGIEHTPLLHKAELDPETLQPKGLYTSETADYNYVDLVKANDINELDAIKKYNVDHNLFNVHDAARHKQQADLLAFAKEAEEYLEGLKGTRKTVEQSIRRYNDLLDEQAINEILTRADRVSVLKAEAKLRAGHLYFETPHKVDLTDFQSDKNLVVVSNIKTPHGTYGQVLCHKIDAFNNADDIRVPVRMVKSKELPDGAFNFIKKCRQKEAAVVTNVGLSHATVLKPEFIDQFHEFLYRVGVPKETIALLPDADFIKSTKYFDILRANNSIIGGSKTWAFFMNDPSEVCITDPFKQLMFNTRSIFDARNTTMMGLANLMCNEHNSIKTSALFAPLTRADKYKLLKDHPDFGMYYIKESGYWDKTKTNYVVKEIQLVNENSIKLAEDANAYILPRTYAQQLMEAFNEYELPPIAQFVKDISDVYKIAYLSSIGFLIRNLIDSNYKTYVELEGTVSLPTQLKRFFSTAKLVKKYTTICQEYTGALHKHFKTDLDYDVFYKFCNRYSESNLAEAIASEYNSKYRYRIINQVDKLKTVFKSVDQIEMLKKQLIDPKLFSLIDVFIKTGPSSGLSRTVINNMVNPTKQFDELRTLQKFNKLMTEHTPLKYVFDTNALIEQSARLSMFLADLERGSSIDDTIKNVIKAHFDYSDKSLGMLYTEIVFPFMSFSYKNLDFWIEHMYKNPLLVGQLENIFRPIMNYQSVFNPDQEAYENFDYRFDWSKDVTSFQSRAPWTTINAARLYHLLAGNIVIDSGKDVSHNAGYGYKDNDLFYVFKLSPSVLDAVKMLYNPLNTYTERMLPPAEALTNITLKVLNGEAPVDDISVTSLMNMLPYTDVIAQRIGLKGNFELKHNNIVQRINDGGPLMAIGSMFGLAYSPKKTNNFWYDSDYNILGGFKTNYYAKRIYSNPYESAVPQYTIRRMAQNKKPRDIYAPSKTTRITRRIVPANIARFSKNIIKHRVKDYKYYL